MYIPVSSVNAVNFVQKINDSKSKFNSVRYTGYGALGFGIASGVVASGFKKVKVHKYLAYISAGLALVHTALIEFRHHNKSKK